MAFNICEVFVNYSTNQTLRFKQSYSMLLNRISHITNDPNSSTAIHQSRQILPELSDPDPFEFNNDVETEHIDGSQLRFNQNTQKITRTDVSRRDRPSLNKPVREKTLMFYANVYMYVCIVENRNLFRELTENERIILTYCS